MTKQCQFKVFKWLTRGRSITQVQANTKAFDHCSRLAAVIDRLRKFMTIKTEMVASRTGGAPYAKYFYVPTVRSK